MNYKMMGLLVSAILGIETILMLPALMICVYDGDSAVALAFLYTMVLLLFLSGILFLFCRKAEHKFYAREGMVSVGFSWLIMSLLGCLPFYITGQIPSYVDALFETVSGFTTTGASILTDVEALSRGLLYWRSFTHWVGGMGVLVLLLVFMNSRGQDGGFTMHLLRAESPGPDVGKFLPKMRQSAIVLYVIYVVMTLLNIFFLLLGSMPLFDAVCTAFGTAGTGGFGIRNDSIASYSPYIQNVCTVFMLLFGVNFSCYFLLLIKQWKAVLKYEELHFYLGTVLVSTTVIVLNIRGMYGSLGETIRHAAFQVSSIITTTGFATTDFDLWPELSKAILLVLMVIGACAGSTGGGIKCLRVLLLAKALRRSIRQMIYPNKVEVVRLNQKAVNEKILSSTNIYLTAYVLIVILSFVFISFDNFSTGTNLSACLACFNNIGPGLEAVGPTCNYSIYSDFSKIVLIFDMLAGRLEIFPVLVLLNASTWKRK